MKARVFWNGVAVVVLLTLALVVAALLLPRSWQAPLQLGAAFFPAAMLAVLTWSYVQQNQHLIEVQQKQLELEWEIAVNADLLETGELVGAFGAAAVEAQGVALQLWNRGRHAVRVSAYLEPAAGAGGVSAVLCDGVVVAGGAESKGDVTAKIMDLVYKGDLQREMLENRCTEVKLTLMVLGAASAPPKVEGRRYSVSVAFMHRSAGTMPFYVVHCISAARTESLSMVASETV